MTHPKHEELAAFLYEDGLRAARRAEVARHVDACDECRALVDGWRGLRTNLAAWQLPAVARMPAAASRSSAAGAGFRWAVAAAVLLSGGFALARMTEKPVDLAALRTDLAKELRKEVRQELVAELRNYSAKQAAWQEEFQGEVVNVVRQQAANHASLRKDLETMAVLTEEEIQRLSSVARVTPAMLPTTEQ
jgi:hypothetical protein